MKEKVTSEEFVAPTKVHIKTSITANSSQYSEKMDVEIYQDLDNYGYSMKMFAEETEAGEKQEESMYMGVWLEGTVLYMAMAEGETKEYAKMDCGEQATEMFYSSIQGAGQSFDKTFFATQLDMVAAIFDTEAMENSLKEALGAFAASAEVNASTSAATKGEGKMIGLIPFVLGMGAGYVAAVLFTLIGYNACGSEYCKVVDFSSLVDIFKNFDFSSIFNYKMFVPNDSESFVILRFEEISKFDWAAIGQIALLFVPVSFVTICEHRKYYWS